MNGKVWKASVEALTNFIIARHAIWIARDEGKPKPWTDDMILQHFRFCNVYRELDTVTVWISEHTRKHDGEPDQWFAFAVARWVNWPDTLAEIGYPVPWNKKKFLGALTKRKEMGEKVWTGAYMIGTQGNAMDKPQFIAGGVLQPLWDQRAHLRPREGDTLKSFADRIIAVKNQGRFMVGQIVADAKYHDPILAVASDWHTWAVSGPGSRRGLNRVVGNNKDAPWRESEWLQTLSELRSAVNKILPPWMDQLHAQDLQNCLCEFDKYERVRLGEGRPRSLYPGHA